LNRRRFLKYAGSTAAVIGASALGLDYLLKPTPLIEQTFTSSTEAISTTSVSTTSSASTTETSTSGELPPIDLAANDLGGYVFHDYSGNGMLDEGEPFVNDVEIVAQGYYATLKVKPQNGIYVFRNLPGDRYKLYPVSADNRFRYMCRSNVEPVETKQGYTVDFRGRQRQDMALMEGFLTLPFSSRTKFETSNLYDWDPRIGYVKRWNGTTFSIRDDKGPDNHTGIDYRINTGSPVIAPAPGIIEYHGVGSNGQIWLQILHDPNNRLSTGYNHLSRITVADGEKIARGQKIAETGTTGTKVPHLHLNIQKAFSSSLGFHLGFFDLYKPIFPIDEKSSGFWARTDQGNDFWRTYPEITNPNLFGYWTKDNDPQYPF